MKPKKRIIFTSNELSEILDSGAPVEEVLSLIHRLLEKNYAIKTINPFERISQSSIEKDSLDSIIRVLVQFLENLDKCATVKITPVVKGEIFAIEILNRGQELE